MLSISRIKYLQFIITILYEDKIPSTKGSTYTSCEGPLKFSV